jgi:hypothetical protein
MSRRALVWLVTLSALVAAGSCSDFQTPEDFTTLDSVAAPTASDPLTAPSLVASRVTARLSAPASPESEVAYVSLPPGTVPEGGIATITNARLDVAVSTGIQDGGFDPVSIAAAPGDELVISIEGNNGVTATLQMTVPRAARPRVVRANPPPGKRDVPLNSRIVVVFSEPLGAGSEVGITLRHAGALVSSAVSLAPDGLHVEITPNGLLAPNTEYEILISTVVRDLDGQALERGVRSSFTTGTTQIAASVATDPAALIVDPSDHTQRTFVMSAVRDDNGRFSGRFSIFYAQFGLRVFGSITCFTILSGSTAWVAGVVEGSTDTAGIGRALGWIAFDNGLPGASAPDELSLAVDLANDGLGTPQHFCATTPSTANLALRTLISGNIVVNRSGPPPPPSNDISQIAFAVWPNGGIQVIDADGTNGRLLTTLEGDWGPTWSPDGTQIAFSRRQASFAGDIYVMNADGSGLKRLTDDGSNDANPAWSPDGSKIAFERNGAIYVMNADGSAVQPLTSGGSDFDPTWSPDGSRIAFGSSRKGANAIYVMASDGTAIHQITSGLVNDYHPSWSPDGQRIAFQRVDSTFWGIYLINPDGTGQTKLTLFGQTPSWSHDSRVIVFEQYGLTVVNADGSGMLRLGIGFDPAWSPEGSMPTRPPPFVYLTIIEGNAQSGARGTTLPLALRVRASREDGSPVAGANISWYLPNSELTGNSWLSDYGSVTNELGLASVVLTLGPTAPPLIPIRATVTDGTGLTPGVEFTAKVVP